MASDQILEVAHGLQDLGSAVRGFFQEATSRAAAQVVAAAFDSRRQEAGLNLTIYITIRNRF